MPDIDPTEELRIELRHVRERLDEATSTLDAIRNGGVDALIVGGGDGCGERVFTLEGADHPYRVLIEAMQQGAATLSADGTILFCNRSLMEMLRTPQEKLSGVSLSSFVPTSDQPRLHAMLQQAQESHSHGEIRLITGDGARLPVRLALSALPLMASRALGLIVTDLTDQKHQEELVAAHRRKDDFLAILAHELRNPLAPIRTAIHLLKMPGANGSVADKARDMIERQVGNLTRLVDELLDVSRISRGKIHLRKEPLELSFIVKSAVEAARPLMKMRRHQLHVDLPPKPLWLEGDSTRLEQVIVNLLNNAAKYTEPGGTIDFRAALVKEQIVISIKDNGVGIAPEMLAHVFEMFTQADHSLDRTQGGLGIGLTLVQSLVRLHGGEITGHSDGLGKGSEFVVRLPAMLEPPSPAPARGPETLERKPRSLRIAVIDDNRDAGESLGLLLRIQGHDVEVFHSGTDALEAIPKQDPDVILLDIGLPDMDGYQVAYRIRHLDKGSDALLVAVTGYGQDEDRRRTASVGFDFHLVKPVDPEALTQVLQTASSRGISQF